MRIDLRVKIQTISLLFIAFSSFLESHPLIQNAMWIKIEPERVRISLASSLQEISIVQNESVVSIASNPERLHQAVHFQSDYLLQHLHLKSGGRLLQGKSSFISE